MSIILFMVMENVFFLLVIYLVVSIVIQLIFFVPAYLLKTDVFTDFTYSLSFIILGIISYIVTEKSLFNTLLLILLILWALRLGVYLVYRINKFKGKDKRFDGIRENIGSFLKFWILQGITVWILMIPVIIFMYNNIYLTISVIIGSFIVFLGLLIESISDIQKIKFILNPKNKNKWIESGIWKYSRHPNYFGEILIWIGVFIFTVTNQMSSLIGIISPLTIALLLIFVTGIPPLEKNANKKWGDNEKYLEYKKRTPVLIPFIKN